METAFYITSRRCRQAVELEVKSKYGNKEYPSRGIHECGCGRFICARYGQVKDLIDWEKRFHRLDTDKFFERYGDKVPKDLKEEEFMDYSIFPLE